MVTQRVTAQPWPRGPQNDLHRAANDGSVERVVALLASRSSIAIDAGAEYGWTPLMLAAWRGSSRVVRILLNKGANVSVVAEDGHTALHFSTQDGGHPVVTKMLLKAGADIEAVTSEGETPLHLAANAGCWEVAQVLIEAGACVNSVRSDGETPLYSAARQGHKKATRVLLRAKANPLLTKPTPSGVTFVPLDTAAEYGQTEVVRELIKQVSIKGCGGASGGVYALRLAALSQNVDVMSVLADAGVMDTGEALITAAGRNDEAGVKLLLQQRHGTSAGGELYMYVNDTHDLVGRTPLLCSIDGGMAGFRCSPRVVRLLVDAGADTVSAVPLKGTAGQIGRSVTPIDFATCSLHENMDGGKTAMEKHVHKLRAIHRLFSQVEAERSSFDTTDDHDSDPEAKGYKTWCTGDSSVGVGVA
ncbi:unnamed protein product [Ectocarpus sp. CCAP 1310/34]|nr:unnamed protein product [Ectocarpus sp. CCAP 1310/34]